MSVNNVNSASGVGSTSAASAAQDVAATLMGATVGTFDDQLEDMNDDLKKNNEDKQEVRTDQAEASSVESNTQNCTANGVGSGGWQITAAQQAELNELSTKYGLGEFPAGVSSVDENGQTQVVYTKEAFETAMENLKDAMSGKIETLNSTSELKMIKFQGLMDARKQAIMMLTNMIQSQSQTNQGIIQNMKG